MSLNVIESPWCLVGAGMEHRPSDFNVCGGGVWDRGGKVWGGRCTAPG